MYYWFLHINELCGIYLLPFSTINNVSISVKRSNFTLVFFKAAFHVNPGAERNFAGSSLYTLRQIFLKVSNAATKKDVSL